MANTHDRDIRLLVKLEEFSSWKVGVHANNAYVSLLSPFYNETSTDVDATRRALRPLQHLAGDRRFMARLCGDRVEILVV